MYDVVMMTGVSMDNNGYNLPMINNIIDFFRPVGPHRIRTFLDAHGYKTKIIDYTPHYTVEQIDILLESTISKHTKVLGISSTWADFKPETFMRLDDLIKKYKSKFPNIKVVVGGPNPTTTVMDCIDLYVTGYGEQALLSILKDDYKRVSYTSNGTMVLNGTFDYGFPNEYRTKWLPEDKLLPTDVVGLEVGRGCIFKCAFCSFPLNGKKKGDHIADMGSLYDELMYNYETFGLTRYTLTCDTFNDSMDKMEGMLKVIEQLPFDFRFTAYVKPELLCARPEQIDLMLALGIESTSLGIESLNGPTRKAIQKGYDYEKIAEKLIEMKSKAHKMGRKVFTHQYNMIIGLPHESMEQVIENRERLLNAYECDGISLNPLIIYNKNNHSLYPLSPIDMDPEKYGYKVRTITSPDGKTPTFYWQNEHMNLGKAFKQTGIMQIDNLRFAKVASFQGANLWNIGFNVEEHFEKTDGRWNQITKEQVDTAEKFIQKRVDDYFESMI